MNIFILVDQNDSLPPGTVKNGLAIFPTVYTEKVERNILFFVPFVPFLVPKGEKRDKKGTKNRNQKKMEFALQK